MNECVLIVANRPFFIFIFFIIQHISHIFSHYSTYFSYLSLFKLFLISSLIIQHISHIFSHCSIPTITKLGRDSPLSLVCRTGRESKRAIHTPALLILRDGERQSVSIHRLRVRVGRRVLGVVDECLRHLFSDKDIEGEGVHGTGVKCVCDVGHGDSHGLHIHEGLLGNIHMVVANGNVLVVGDAAYGLALVEVVCRHT